MSNYRKAEPLHRQAMEIEKRILGENHPDYAGTLNSLANLYQDMGEYRKSEPLHQQAIEIWKRTLGENHPKYAMALRNLANTYLRQGRVRATPNSDSLRSPPSMPIGLTTRWRWWARGSDSSWSVRNESVSIYI